MNWRQDPLKSINRKSTSFKNRLKRLNKSSFKLKFPLLHKQKPIQKEKSPQKLCYKKRRVKFKLVNVDYKIRQTRRNQKIKYAIKKYLKPVSILKYKQDIYTYGVRSQETSPWLKRMSSIKQKELRLIQMKRMCKQKLNSRMKHHVESMLSGKMW